MQEYIRASGVANRVRMKRSYYPEHTFLLVEGEDDAAFFRRHTNVAKCRIQVAYGKPNVLEALGQLTDFPGVLGIVDRDFEYLTDFDCTTDPNLLVTDLHDIESMILASPALAHVLSELGDEERIAKAREATLRDVVAQLLQMGSVVGFARLASHRNLWKLKFDGLDFARFVDANSFTLDPARFYPELRAHQGGRTISPPDEFVIRTESEALAQENHDLWQICCGHDLVGLLSIGLTRALGGRRAAEVSADQLERLLRASYESHYFVQTRLRSAMALWEARNSPFQVL